MLSILYRGPLASCNYGCEYCPFAKRVDSRAQLAEDARALERFVAWVGGRESPTRVLFTPWGEALIRRPYQRALVQLAAMEHVARVAIQTNLSASIDWLEQLEQLERPARAGAHARAQRVGIWATFHPDWAERDPFIAKVRALASRGVHISVGVVGMREHFAAIADLRGALPDDIYLWVNAFKREPDYYTAAEIAWLGDIDPLFSINNRHHPSLGRRCAAGHRVISVDGAGDVRRCHFIRAPVLGNIYTSGPNLLDGPAPCSNRTCGCHIGYVHLEYLELGSIFGPNILERVPVSLPARPATTDLPRLAGATRSTRLVPIAPVVPVIAGEKSMSLSSPHDLSVEPSYDGAPSERNEESCT